jgi:heat shock protein HslJ
MPNQSTAPRRASALARAGKSVGALTLATLVAACAIPKHPDTSAPPSDPFNPAATQLLDDTHWTLAAWKNADGSAHALPDAAAGNADGAAGEPLTLDFSTETGQRRASGFDGCNQYTGRYALKNGALSFDALASTRKACPEPAADLEHAYLDALAHIAKTGVQMKPPRQLEITLEDGGTLIFAQRRGQ